MSELCKVEFGPNWTFSWPGYTTEQVLLHASDGGETGWMTVIENGPGIAAIKIMNMLVASKDTLAQELHDQGIEKEQFSIFGGGVSEKEKNHLTAAAIFYQGVYLFLSHLEVKTYTCAELFAAWQWYNYEKALYVEAEKIGSEEKYLRLIRLDMAQAYRSLTALLNSPHYASALRWLAGIAVPPWETGDEMDSTLRERLLRSLFMTTEEGAKKMLANPEELPLPAPGMEKVTSWGDLTLHPIFKQDHKREVVRFIYSVLLPRYDFRSALKMAVLETSDTPPVDTPLWRKQFTDVYNRVRLSLANPLFLWSISIIWLILTVLLGHVLAVPSGSMDTGSASLLRINIAQILFFSVLIIAARLLFGPNFII